MSYSLSAGIAATITGLTLSSAALAAAGEQEMKFTVRIENIAPAGAIKTSAGSAADVVLAPGVWVVHTQPAPLFRRDRRIADKASKLPPKTAPESLAKSVASMSDVEMKADAKKGAPMKGAADAMPKAGMSKDTMSNAVTTGVFNTRSGSDSPGILRPDQAYEFTVTARPGCRLSLASMYVQSNDCFLGSVEEGIPLFDEKGRPNRGDMTEQVRLWDAGTEVNQEPGAGSDQGARQSGHNVGADERGVVRPVNDGYVYPKVAESFRVTIMPLSVQ